MDFIEAFLGGAAEVVTSFGTVLVNATTAITNIVYNSSVEGGGLTIVGASLALAMGVGAVYLIFRMVRGLIKQNNRG